MSATVSGLLTCRLEVLVYSLCAPESMGRYSLGLVLEKYRVPPCCINVATSYFISIYIFNNGRIYTSPPHIRCNIVQFRRSIWISGQVCAYTIVVKPLGFAKPPRRII